MTCQLPNPPTKLTWNDKYDYSLTPSIKTMNFSSIKEVLGSLLRTGSGRLGAYCPILSKILCVKNQKQKTFSSFLCSRCCSRTTLVIRRFFLGLCLVDFPATEDSVENASKRNCRRISQSASSSSRRFIISGFVDRCVCDTVCWLWPTIRFRVKIRSSPLDY